MRSRLLPLIVAALVTLATPALAQSTTGVRGAGEAMGSAMKDTWLTSKTKSKLLADKRVKAGAISVETNDGVVTLRGKVAYVGEKRAAEEIARRTEGVRAVNNALQVVPDARRKAVDARDAQITKAVKARLEKNPVLKDLTISVRSDDGLVTLRGGVPTLRTKSAALDLVRRTPGVKAVRDELKVKQVAAAQ